MDSKTSTPLSCSIALSSRRGAGEREIEHAPDGGGGGTGRLKMIRLCLTVSTDLQNTSACLLSSEKGRG